MYDSKCSLLGKARTDGASETGKDVAGGWLKLFIRRTKLIPRRAKMDQELLGEGSVTLTRREGNSDD